jgi:hypothetical protein
VTGYLIALWLHSYVRWALLFAMVVVVATSWLALRRQSAWTPQHERWLRVLVSLADLQFTIGVLLYLVWSPFAAAFMQSPGTAMKEHTIRFFGLEHPTMMVVAVAFLHVGRTRSKELTDARDKHRTVLRWTLFALLVLFTSIPWPGLRHGRPLLRFGTGERSTMPGNTNEAPWVIVRQARQSGPVTTSRLSEASETW